MNASRALHRRFALFAASALLALGWAGTSPAAEAPAEAEPAPPAVTIEAIEVTPDKLEADMLCKLTVKIKNAGERPVSGFGFRVTVAGKELSVYETQLFFQIVPAGKTVEVPLFNFWTSESQRPAPADGKLPVEVTLTEAVWMETSTDDDGVEVWKVLEAVPGLPTGRTLPLKLAGAEAAAKDAG